MTFYPSILKAISDERVLVMLSGGEDSALCLMLLKKNNINFEAIHFYHKWMWRLSTSQARKIAKENEVKLHIFDITKDFFNKFNNFLGGRPCRQCKPIMYQKVIDFALKNGFNWICVGDNKYDTVVQRIREYENKRDNKDLIVTRYLDCINEGVKIPSQIQILRPIIEMTPGEIAMTLGEYGVKIEKNFETGDKYFKYWREGCPIQYNEAKSPLTRKRMEKLYKYNLAATRYGKKHNFRASVHLPSFKIITIPRGHKREIRGLLIKKFKLKI